MTSQADRISRARMRVILAAPFFGSLLMRLRMVRNDSIPTFCTDGESIMYNERFSAALSDSDLRGVLVHEVAHNAQGHLWRRGQRDPAAWNVACDYAVNELLVSFVTEERKAYDQKHGSGRYVEPWTLPAGGLLDPQFKKMAAEEIYALLPRCGLSAAAGLPDGARSMGEMTDPVTGADGSSKEEEWQIAVSQAATQARMRGNMPGCLDRFVHDLLYPKVPWRELLREFVRKLARDDYSFARPNSRFAHTGMILPSLRSYRMGRLVIAVDTSGSINHKLLAEFQAEVQAALDECQPEAIEVLYCDAAVQSTEEFTPGDLVRLNAKGGGGTCFEPVFEHIETAGELPEALIYLTDGYGSCSCKEPDYPVLWATVGEEKFPFGQVVAVK